MYHANILEGSVYFLAYINDILIALKHLCNTDNSPLKPEESDEDDDDSVDDDDLLTDSKKSSLSSSGTTEYDPNKLCTYTTTKKEYTNQHW